MVVLFPGEKWNGGGGEFFFYSLHYTIAVSDQQLNTFIFGVLL